MTFLIPLTFFSTNGATGPPANHQNRERKKERKKKIEETEKNRIPAPDGALEVAGFLAGAELLDDDEEEEEEAEGSWAEREEALGAS